jgi:hypothetical protein
MYPKSPPAPRVGASAAVSVGLHMLIPVGRVQEEIVPVVSWQPTTSGTKSIVRMANPESGELMQYVPTQLVEHVDVGVGVQYVLQELNVLVSHSVELGLLSGLLGSSAGGMPPGWSGSIPLMAISRQPVVSTGTAERDALNLHGGPILQPIQQSMQMSRMLSPQ